VSDGQRKEERIERSGEKRERKRREREREGETRSEALIGRVEEGNKLPFLQ
jgi:hypothetical protein